MHSNIAPMYPQSTCWQHRFPSQEVVFSNLARYFLLEKHSLFVNKFDNLRIYPVSLHLKSQIRIYRTLQFLAKRRTVLNWLLNKNTEIKIRERQTETTTVIQPRSDCTAAEHDVIARTEPNRTTQTQAHQPASAASTAITVMPSRYYTATSPSRTYTIRLVCRRICHIRKRAWLRFATREAFIVDVYVC